MGMVVGERFLILERLGHGGSGTIYRAEHVTLRRKVAVKVLHHELSRDELAVERFRREATMVSELDNEHIVEIHDFGRTDDGRLYLAMELLEGETLQDLIKRERRLPVEQTVDVLLQLGEALAEAHAMGYVHRDLRPRNVWLATRRGKSNFVKLLDFGLAKLVVQEGRAAVTSLGMTFGDPKYMAPEQARGEDLDRRADIYSLGCIAYEMLVGEPPFAVGKAFDILAQHLDSTPPTPRERRDDVPPWLSRAVMHMLAKQPEDRFITVYRLMEILRAGMAGAPEPQEAPRPRTPTPVVGVAPARNPGVDSGTNPGFLPQATAAAPEEPAARDAAEPAPEAPAQTVTAAGAVPIVAPAIVPAAASPAAGGLEEARAPEPWAAADHAGAGRDTVIDAPPASARAPEVTLDIRSSAAREDAPDASDAAPDADTAPAPDADTAPAGEAAARETAEGATESADTGRDTVIDRPPGVAAAGTRTPAGVDAAGGDGTGADVSGGLAGAWFADAEGGLDESSRKRLDNARTLFDEDDTMLVGGRRRLGKIAIVGGVLGLLALVLPIVLLGPSSEHAPAESAQDSGARDAATTPSAAALLAAIDQPMDAAVDAAAGDAAGPADAGVTPPDAAARSGAGAAGSAPVRRSGQDQARAPADEPAAVRRKPLDERDTLADPWPVSKPSAETARQAEFFAKLGQQALRNGDIPGAAGNFKKARELDAKNADAIIGQGEIALRQGSYPNAITYLKQGARLRPRSAHAHTLLGEAYLGAGNRAQAATSFKRALALEPGNNRAREGYSEAAGTDDGAYR